MIPVQNFLFEKRYRFSRFQFNLAALLFVVFGFIFATYVGTSKIQEIFAFNDTTNVWTFNAANAGQFTYNSGIITVDNSGARPTSPNKLSNPSFNSDNSSWTTAAMPPTGWSEVPADSNYSTTNFLVMKYEAKCAATSDPTTGLTTPNTGTGLTYADNTTACTAVNSKQVVSVASGYPIANISQTNSATRCSTVTLNGNAAHLINNNEWMTMARNMENVNADWTSGTAGTGTLFRGHTDNSPATSLQGSTDDTDGYNGTGNSSGSSPEQKRTMTLSNGSVIWDMSGNVHEWVNNTIQRKDQPVAWNGTTDDSSGFNYSDYSSGSLARYIHTWKVGSPLQYINAGPAHTAYNANQNVGRIYHYSDPADINTTTYGFLRGGYWSDGAIAGVFYLYLNFTPTFTYNSVGFRCASDPVAISQSYLSSTGRSGGGDQITIGSISDGKVYQSINVGDTSTYDFSAYVYDNTSGNVGGAVSTSIAQLEYNGSAISTTYTSVGSGWYQLTGAVTGANASKEYGVIIKAGKTVKIDDLTTSKQATYSIYTTSAYQNGQVSSWDSFANSVTASGNASVVYQICTDDGSTCESGSSWKYWTGSSWTTASNTTTHTNTAAQLDQTAMQALPVVTKKLSVKAIMNFGGSDVPTINSITIGLTTDTTAPITNASALAMKRSATGASVTSNGWTNNSAPYFSWTAGADNSGGSGIRGYCLYLGTDSAGDPATSKGLLGTSPGSLSGSTCQFVITTNSVDFATTAYRGATWLSSANSAYYLNVKAIDNGGNVYGGASAQFPFRFDNTLPTNPSYLSLPGDFIATKSATILWSSTGADAAADTNSGIEGLQYRIGQTGTWYGDTHNGSQDETDLLTNDGTYQTQQTPDYVNLTEGSNLIYLRTWDNAGNVTTSYISGALKINTTSPSAPRNLAVSSSDSTTNSYSFTWDDPSAYTGQANKLTFCYTINTVPTATNCNFTAADANSLSADAYATQPGTNTLYLVARDEAGNLNYEAYASVAFTYSGSAPGIPRNVDVSDISIKATSNWKLAVSWDAPSDTGAGVKTYKILRSTTATTCSASPSSFTEIGSTAGTSYSDSGLSQQSYAYCVKACDSANNCSAVSSSVSKTPNGKYFTPPSLITKPTVSGITTKRAKITWSTDRSADSKVAYGTKSGSYQDEEPSNSTQTTDHIINLTNLSPGTTYFYKVKWTDEDGNTGTSDENSFTTDPAPTVKDITAKNIGLSNVFISFTTTGSSKVKIYYGTGTSFGGAKELATGTGESTYTQELSGLTDGTKYYFKINTFDSEGAEYEGSILDFTTFPRPKISGVRIQEVKGTAEPTVDVFWNSNTEVSSIATYYPIDQPSQTRDEVTITLTKGPHKLRLKGLFAQTKYALIVKGRDKLGNEASSDVQTFTTSTDTRPPEMSNVKIEGATVPSVGSVGQAVLAQLIVSWDTDEPATSQIEFGEGTGATYSQLTQEDTNLTTNHLVVISGLSTARVYHLRTVSKDKAGNVGNSIDSVTITPKSTDSALNLVIGNLSQIFGFLNKFNK